MTVEDLLTDNVYTFELQEELVRSSECDSWKEIAVQVDTAVSQTIPPSDQQKTADDGDQARNDDVSDAVDKVAASVTHLPQSQLLGYCTQYFACFFKITDYIYIVICHCCSTNMTNENLISKLAFFKTLFISRIRLSHAFNRHFELLILQNMGNFVCAVFVSQRWKTLAYWVHNIYRSVG